MTNLIDWSIYLYYIWRTYLLSAWVDLKLKTTSSLTPEPKLRKLEQEQQHSCSYASVRYPSMKKRSRPLEENEQRVRVKWHPWFEICMFGAHESTYRPRLNRNEEAALVYSPQQKLALLRNCSNFPHRAAPPCSALLMYTTMSVAVCCCCWISITILLLLVHSSTATHHYDLFIYKRDQTYIGT